MKTTKNLRIANSLTVLLVVSVLFLAGCQKDSVLPQNKSVDTNGYANDRQSTGTAQSEATSTDLAVRFAVDMIKIDHIAARSLAPDYSITVKFDGTAVFEGRRNIAYLGTKEWKLDMNTFYDVKQLFEHSGFNSIENHLSLLADVPMVYTTWCPAPTDFSKTLFDYNDGYPEGLIGLREKAEAILDLSLLTKSDVKVVATAIDASL